MLKCHVMRMKCQGQATPTNVFHIRQHRPLSIHGDHMLEQKMTWYIYNYLTRTLPHIASFFFFQKQ
jgi:hypothetical protein